MYLQAVNYQPKKSGHERTFALWGGATGEADCFLKHGCNHRFGEHTSCLWENARFLKIGGDTGCPVERGCETSFLDETP